MPSAPPAPRVLLVEDEPILAFEIRGRLHALGYAVPAVVARAEEVPQAIERHSPDVVLMDISLGGAMDGVAAAGEVRERWGIPVIFITGHSDRHTVERAKSAAPHGYLVKPIDDRVLALTLELALTRGALEARLRASERKFRRLADSSPVMIWICDEERRCTFLNRRWLQVTGRSFESGLGAGWLEALHEHDRASADAAFASAFAERKDFRAEFRLIAADGGFRRVLAVAQPLLSEEGLFEGYAGSCLDITDTLAARETLHHTRQLESLATLASGVAHEFNNLFTGVIGHAGLLQSENLAPEQESRFAGAIIEASRRGARLVDKLLHFARREAVILQPLSLGALIETWTATYRARLPPGLALELTLSPALPRLLGEPTQLLTALDNLAANALDALAPRSRGVIRLSLVAVSSGRLPRLHRLLEPARDYLRLEFADDGAGMAPEVRRRAFEPFFSTKPVGQGAGLGLSEVHGIVEGHRGSIELESAPGRGTVVRLFLPALSEESAAGKKAV